MIAKTLVVIFTLLAGCKPQIPKAVDSTMRTGALDAANIHPEETPEEQETRKFLKTYRAYPLQLDDRDETALQLTGGSWYLWLRKELGAGLLSPTDKARAIDVADSPAIKSLRDALHPQVPAAAARAAAAPNYDQVVAAFRNLRDATILAELPPPKRAVVVRLGEETAVLFDTSRGITLRRVSSFDPEREMIVWLDKDEGIVRLFAEEGAGNRPALPQDMRTELYEYARSELPLERALNQRLDLLFEPKRIAWNEFNKTLRGRIDSVTAKIIPILDGLSAIATTPRSFRLAEPQIAEAFRGKTFTKQEADFLFFAAYYGGNQAPIVRVLFEEGHNFTIDLKVEAMTFGDDAVRDVLMAQPDRVTLAATMLERPYGLPNPDVFKYILLQNIEFPQEVLRSILRTHLLQIPESMFPGRWDPFAKAYGMSLGLLLKDQRFINYIKQSTENEAFVKALNARTFFLEAENVAAPPPPPAAKKAKVSPSE